MREESEGSVRVAVVTLAGAETRFSLRTGIRAHSGMPIDSLLCSQVRMPQPRAVGIANTAAIPICRQGDDDAADRPRDPLARRVDPATD